MITPDYVRRMARYNRWQNEQLQERLAEVPAPLLKQDQGAFFGSILGTLNHILWGDQMWMSRFDTRLPKPDAGIPESPALHPTLAAWGAARVSMDGQIAQWARTLRAVDLAGELRWYSGALNRDVRKPFALCIVHLFNHQTHHRGQVHAMMTRAHISAPVSDLFAMPDKESCD